MQWIYTHGGVFPVRRGYARRGGVHHRAHDPRARRDDRDVLRGRPLAHRQAVRAAPSAASAGWRWRRARRSCPIAIHGSSKVRNWKRLQFPKVTVQLRRPDRAGSRSRSPTREQQQAVADEIFAEIKQLYAGLEQHGRKGVVARVREERRAARRAKRAAPDAGTAREATAASGKRPAGPTQRRTSSQSARDDVVGVGEDGVVARAAGDAVDARRRPTLMRSSPRRPGARRRPGCRRSRSLPGPPSIWSAPRSPVEVVVALVAEHDVVAAAAEHLVVAGAAVQDVVAVLAVDVVVAARCRTARRRRRRRTSSRRPAVPNSTSLPACRRGRRTAAARRWPARAGSG